jgi:hypothetical protein
MPEENSNDLNRKVENILREIEKLRLEMKRQGKEYDNKLKDKADVS